MRFGAIDFAQYVDTEIVTRHAGRREWQELAEATEIFVFLCYVS